MLNIDEIIKIMHRDRKTMRKYLDLKEGDGRFRKDMNKVQIDHALGIFKIVTLGNRTLFVKKRQFAYIIK